MNIVINTDGSCINNGQPNASAGWSFVASKGNEVIYSNYGKLKGSKQTNNRAEMFALYQALLWLKDHPKYIAEIQSDSTTVIDGILGDAQRKANRDIWEPIEKLVPLLHNQIRGAKHIPSEENLEADKLAFRAANALIILK